MIDGYRGILPIISAIWGKDAAEMRNVGAHSKTRRLRALAASPCAMNVAGATTHVPLPDKPCKSADCQCFSVTACCEAAPNLLAPVGSEWIAPAWRQVVYSGAPQALNGQQLSPELHPPTNLG
jgi:hypothetical protein